MKGELGGLIKKVKIQGYGNKQDLQLIDDKGEFLFICGDNNWIDLLQNAIDTFKHRPYMTLIDNDDNVISEYIIAEEAYIQLTSISSCMRENFKVLSNYGIRLSIDHAIGIIEENKWKTIGFY